MKPLRGFSLVTENSFIVCGIVKDGIGGSGKGFLNGGKCFLGEINVLRAAGPRAASLKGCREERFFVKRSLYLYWGVVEKGG